MAYPQHAPRREQLKQASPSNREAHTTAQASRDRPDGNVAGKIIPMVLDTAPWGQTIAGLPDHPCDIITTLAATSFVHFGREEGMDLQKLLILTDTSMESRLLSSALRETGLERCQVRTQDNLPPDIVGTVVIIVSAAADNSFRQMRRYYAAGALLRCIVCNTATKGGGFRKDAADLGAQILEVDADLLCTMAGPDARWVSSPHGLPQDMRDWVPAATKPGNTNRSLFVVPRSDHRILISSRNAGNGGNTSVSLAVDLPQTMNLFLLEGLELDPFYVASTFHTCGITSDLDGCSVQLAPISRKRTVTSHDATRPATPARRCRQMKSGSMPVPKDRSRHYSDDRWYETEAEKEAQDRRQGGKFSYSDMGVKRQGRSSGLTSEQTLRLLKIRGIAGKD